MAAPTASETVIVVTGGDPIDPTVRAELPDAALVVAADSGVDHALALGLRIDVAVGDFDSVTPDGLRAAADAGAVLERHPAAKDATDLELALDAAMARGARHLHVLGGHGGRLDHLLANAALLASERYATASLVAVMGSARVAVVRHEVTLAGALGDLVTLLPVHGPALGVTTHGLLYPLRGDDLLPGSTRGVSNQLDAPEATVQVGGGVLLAIRPSPATISDPNPDPPRFTA